MRFRPALVLAAPAGVLGGHAIGYLAAPSPVTAALHHGYLALVLAVAVPLAVMAMAWSATVGATSPTTPSGDGRGPGPGPGPGLRGPGSRRPGPGPGSRRSGPGAGLSAGSRGPGPGPGPGPGVGPGPGLRRPGVGPLLVAQWVLFTGQEAVEHAVAGHGAAAALHSRALWWGLAAQVVTALVVVVVLRSSSVVGARLVELLRHRTPVVLPLVPWRLGRPSVRSSPSPISAWSARGPPAPRFA